MKIIKPNYEILSTISEGAINELQHIEQIGRVCYKSEDKITKNSCYKFIKMLLDRGHEAMIEHSSLSVKFIVDRGVSHELVRHRLCSFAQESTRYCNYSSDKFGTEITVIEPIFLDDENSSLCKNIWIEAMKEAEHQYFRLLTFGAFPQEARSVLPNSLKTEVIMTANYREWRHFFKLRTEIAAHPQMRQVTIPLLKELKTLIPVIFDDISIEEEAII